MELFEKLLRAAEHQVDSELQDGKWFDKLTASLESKVGLMQDPTVKASTQAAVDALKVHRGDVLHLGRSSLTLFVSHVAIGDDKKAVLEFIRTTESAEDLIKGVLDDAKAVVKDKKEIEAMKAQAIQLIKDITITGARFLLPVLLAAL